MENAASHASLLQDHYYFIHDRFRDKEPGKAFGRVPLALNHAPTTLEDLGLDPDDPDIARKWTERVTKGLQGLDKDKALTEEFERQQKRLTR